MTRLYWNGGESATWTRPDWHLLKDWLLGWYGGLPSLADASLLRLVRMYRMEGQPSLLKLLVGRS